MKENKITSRIFIHITIAIFVINLIAVFIVFTPAFAVTQDGFCNWTEVFPPNNVLFSGAVTGVISNENNYDIYFCCGKVGNITGPVIMSKTNPTGAEIQGITGSWKVEGAVMHTIVYNGITYYCACINGEVGNTDNNFSYAEFTENGVSWTPQNQTAYDFINYVENGGGGDTSSNNTLNYNLPAGNVAYIEIGDGVPNISMLSTVMPVKSAAFSSETGWNSTQRVGFAESLPSSGENLASFGTQITWIPNGNTNIFGQTQNAKFTAPSLSGHKYLVVVNPLYYAIQYTNGEGIATTEPGVNSTVNNNSVNIFMNYSKGITVYQLTQNVTINNNIPLYSNDVSSGPYEGDIDPDTGDVTWTDPDGGSSQPTTGGGNVPGTGENNFSSFLSGVSNRIVNVFQPAHDAILTLSNAVQNIAGWMYALYVWLPAPVLSILTSAISLAIIIGLIKVFV